VTEIRNSDVSITADVEPAIHQILAVSAIRRKMLDRLPYERQLLIGPRAGRKREEPRVQILPFGQPDEVSGVDRHHDASFVDGAAPDDMIRLTDETAITHMIDVVTGCQEGPDDGWRDVLVEQQTQAAAPDFGRPTSGCASV